ncbi:MAG: hypothetical protein ACRCXZ_10305 [Patescibacteria group bacterium]
MPRLRNSVSEFDEYKANCPDVVENEYWDCPDCKCTITLKAYKRHVSSKKHATNVAKKNSVKEEEEDLEDIDSEECHEEGVKDDTSTETESTDLSSQSTKSSDSEDKKPKPKPKPKPKSSKSKK